MTARLTDAAGNAGANSTATPVTVDTVAPTATVAITAIATDSGTSSSDYVTSDTTLTVSGTHGALGSGEKVQVSSDGGASWADVTTSTASTWSYTDPTPHATSFTYQVRIVDARGQCRCQHRQPGGDHRHGGADGAVDHLDPEENGRRRHQHRRHGTVVVSGTGAGAGDTLKVSRDGGVTWRRHLGQQRDGDVAAATIAAQGQGTFDVTARLTDAAGNAGTHRRLLGDGRHGGADGGGCDHGDYHRQRHASSDYVTSDTTLTVSGTHGPLGSGEKVQVSSDGGASWADVTSTATHLELYRSRRRTPRASPTRRGSSTRVGNVGATPPARTIIIDTTPPDADNDAATVAEGGARSSRSTCCSTTPRGRTR